MDYLKIKNKSIVLHSVKNKHDDSFVGIKINNKTINFYYPETFNLSSIDDLSNFRNDVILILNTIGIAKTFSSKNIKAESNFSNNGSVTLLSYLWILRDYLNNGFWINKEKVYNTNKNGRVNWKRTLETQPIISNKNIIYKDIVVENKNNIDNILVEIHKYCVKISIDLVGWLFGINDSSFIEIKPYSAITKQIYIETLNKEINRTFDDVKRIRLNNMLKIILGLSNEFNEKEIIYGVDKYNYIFERMIDSIFGNEDISKYNPKANWHIKRPNKENKESSPLRPDTILKIDNKYYILDSKFYRYGYTTDINDLPETTSVQKQITYGEYIKRNNLENENVEIRNAFILPYNKYNNKFGFKDNIEYIGYADTDYKNNNEEHEKIYTFLIDLKYVITTWNSNNHNNDIKKLIDEIENAKLNN